MGVAGLDVLDASYMIGVLYTGMMPGRFPGRAGRVLHAAGAVRAVAGYSAPVARVRAGHVCSVDVAGFP